MGADGIGPHRYFEQQQMNIRRTITAIALALSAAIGSSQSGIWVDLDPTRAPQDQGLLIDRAVRDFSAKVNAITKKPRQRLANAGWWNRSIPFSLPTTVYLSSRGRQLAPTRRDPGDISLVFDAAGDRAFPTEYRDLLQNVFNAAKPTLDIVFGIASSAGPVLVKNYDADIGDRDAVAGGYFMPNNGSGQREIRFPVYSSSEAATVNFIHCLLLAYVGPSSYGFDAFQEGLVRAATMKVCRTPGALPAGLDAGLVEGVLDNTYDVGAFYDWYNQRALAGPQFIANNLRNDPLPSGGSLGGVYLLRYQMSGSAWQKLLSENAGFIAEFNRRVYAAPGSQNDVNQLLAIGQAALDTVKGVANSRVEGYLFADWVRRQYVLDTRSIRGRRLLVQPIPITGGLGGTDFGVFDVSATYFLSQAGNNESLLSATAYPIFWDHDFNRVFPGAQEDVMSIAGAYGSVTPNLPDIYGGSAYRATIDIPVADQVARAYVPAGAVATATNPVPNNFYGTVSGLNLPQGSTARVRAFINSTKIVDVPVTRGAFGNRVTLATYQNYNRLRVEVVEVAGATETIRLTRFVNKGPGDLALDLRVGGDVNYTVPGGLLRGIQMIGLPLEPYASDPAEILGLAPAQVQLARYDSTTVSYELYPNLGAISQGGGYFLRLNTAQPAFSVRGAIHPRTPVTVKLRPGWNLISNPLDENVPLTRVFVVKTTQAPDRYTDVAGVDIGTEFFGFVRGANDAASGVPETGTMVAGTAFEAGKAYYVRVLAPEGVNLVFFPSGMSSKPVSPAAASVPPVQWQMKASLLGTKAVAYFGQSATATPLLDNREDAPMAPRTGGLQLTIDGTNPLYRDMRRLNAPSMYRLRFEGLTKGKSYQVQFDAATGQVPPFILFDRSTGRMWFLRASQMHNFVATSSTQLFEVHVYGGTGW